MDTVKADVDPERIVTQAWELRAVLWRISCARSCVDLNWGWDVSPPVYSARRRGWLVAVTFQRPDRDTGKVSRGRGRDMWIESGATESAVVKTALVAMKLILEHELLEAFKVDGRRPFDPHSTIAELTRAGAGIAAGVVVGLPGELGAEAARAAEDEGVPPTQPSAREPE